MSLDAKGVPVTPEGVKTLSKLSGVYLMRDQSGKVIYIGKAKNLRSRVLSYFRGQDGRYNVPYLLEQTATIETVVTENEHQALVLESDLIRKHKPRYNIRLKDDKAHFIVRIDLNNPWPRIDLVRQTQNDGAKYIGPFVFGYELKAMLEVIRATLPLRTCTDRVMMNRVRPCLEYQMKRCPGPCCLTVDSKGYREYVDQAIAILEGRNREVIEELEKAMERASEALLFEEAAALRDRLDVLTRSAEERTLYNFADGMRDAIGMYREDNRIEFSVLLVRRGRLYSAKSFGFDAAELPNQEMLQSFLTQYYSVAEHMPEEILLPINVEDQEVRSKLYSERSGASVRMTVPERGDKARLIKLAHDNARENFMVRFGEGERGGESSVRTLKAELGLEEIPRTIECVDISHFQGGSTVASVVFFKDGQPDKERYRHFHLTQEGKPDDFASMREVVLRHLSRCQEENTVSDLMIIDGGRAQLSQAREQRKELSLTRPVMIGLAKKRTASLPYYALGTRSVRNARQHKPERIFVEDSDTPVVLRQSSPALQLLERVRDEAHRFAITFHRRTRSKRLFKSALDNIPGIGDRRKRELLKAFGTPRNIIELPPDEVASRSGISIRLATQLIDILKKRLPAEIGDETSEAEGQ